MPLENTKTEARFAQPPMPENEQSAIRNPKSTILWLGFAALIFFTYFFGLTLPLVGPDEPRYAQIAREMLERGDWVTPTLGGFDWFEKPALLYWLEIVSYKIFGVNEFAARFGSAVFGLGTIFCLWILGRQWSVVKSQMPVLNRLLPVERAKTNFAEWLALIAATSIGLIVFSRGASFDIILTFPMTAALVGFFIFDQSKVKSAFASRFALLAFYFFIGAALIAKGLVGIVFPAAIVAFYYLLSWRFPSKTFVFSLIWGTVLSLAVAAVWYLPMYQANGWKFIDEFFIQHHFQRFTSDKYQHHQPFWFFFLVLPLMTIPWLPFFLVAVFDYFKSQISNFKSAQSAVRDPQSAIKNFAFAWLAVPLVFFSLSGSKLPGYILPALPAAIILTAIYVFDFARKSEMRERILQITAAAILVFVIVAAQFFAPDYTRHETVKYMIETADAKGFADAKFASLYTVSHNLEFYAAGRLERDADGKLKRYDNFYELVQKLKAEKDAKTLIVVPLASVPYLQKENGAADIETISDNGESAIISIKPK